MASWPLSIRRGLAMLWIGTVASFSMTCARAQAPAQTAEKPVAIERPTEALPNFPPSDPLAAAAYAVLEKHCARCHQGGRLQRASPAADFGNILRLDEIAALPHLVQPGNPDASRLYVMMLRRRMPDDVFRDGAAEPAPTSKDVAAVRRWISGLSPLPRCLDRRLVTTSDHELALSRIANGKPGNASVFRFVSLAHLHNSCVRIEALTAYRQAIAAIFRSLSRKKDPVVVVPVDDAHTLLKVSLDDLGWSPEHWDRIVRADAAPHGLTPPVSSQISHFFGTSVPVIRADWLAETVLVSDASLSERSAAVETLRSGGFGPQSSLDGVDPVIALAKEHGRPLDGVRAAAELGVPLEALERLADQGEGVASVLARRLMQGLVSRSEIDLHARALTSALGRASPQVKGGSERQTAPAVGGPDHRSIDAGSGVVLYSDKLRYRKGDFLSLVVRADVPCHLTLVSVDQRGRGTVIFPSDFVGNSLLQAGQELKLPGPGAPYAFRLNEPGRETIVALCNEAGPLTDGIRHDFERQRFTDLGDYASFLERNVFAETVRANSRVKRRVGHRQIAAGRRGRSDRGEEHPSPERISRTAITIPVD